MNYARAIVAAILIGSAMPAEAQDADRHRSGRRLPAPQVRTLITNYYGSYGRFLFGRHGLGWPVARPRVAWVVDDFVPEGRPLGLSPNAYGIEYDRLQAGRTGWPYYAAGRDEPPPPAPRAASEIALAEGRAHWKAGDYSAALAEFKKAVAADLDSGVARVHMALGLLASGDLNNADKALVSALGSLPEPEGLAGVTMDFRNPKEQAKFEAKLVPGRDGAGALTVALAQHLLGMKEKAAATLNGSEAPAAKRVGELLR